MCGCRGSEPRRGLVRATGGAPECLGHQTREAAHLAMDDEASVSSGLTKVLVEGEVMG